MFAFFLQITTLCDAANKQLSQLVEWAKHIPHFTSLPVQDQVLLLRAGWNELLIAAFSHRSMEVRDGIVLATGLTVHRNSANQIGVGGIFDRVLTELVAKMREMKMDKTELGCLRTIILFNPGKYFFYSLIVTQYTIELFASSEIVLLNKLQISFCRRPRFKVYAGSRNASRKSVRSFRGIHAHHTSR